MSDASGLLALGQALDQYLIGEYSPPPGTQTALGFLPGIAVNPGSFAPTGVVNPFAVQTFLNSVMNVLGPVVDGRFSGIMSARDIYGAVISIAHPVDPPGTPGGDAFNQVRGMALAEFSASPTKPLVAVPLNWYDAGATEGWSTFTSSSSSRTVEETSTSSGEVPTKPAAGETPPILPPPTERFGKLWRWRTLDASVIADVVVPSAEATVEEPEPVVIRDHRVRIGRPDVRDRLGVDLSEVAVRDHRSESGSTRFSAKADLAVAPARSALRVNRLVAQPVAQVAPEPAVAAEAPEVQVLATAPRRQLMAALAVEQPFLARGENVLVRSQALAHLIEVETPARVAEIDGDFETTSTQSVESHDLTLTLDYCFVQVSRDEWWNDAVLRMPRWYAPGSKAGAFSSSSQVEGLPLGVPIAMVVTRNVSVKGTWSAADRSAAESHTSFGPWSTHDSAMAYDASTETATLDIPGMQVVAVVCAVLPPLAPADDPTLAAPPTGAPTA